MNNRNKLIAGCGVLIAASVILQYIEFGVPIVPSFLKFDFSDLPALIGSFAYGPIAGILICLLKNIIHLAVSQSGFVGELSNFILGAIFVGIAGLIYSKKKTKKNAIIACIIGSLVMAIISVPSNYFIVYPLYYNVLNFPQEAILGMYQLILPSTKNILEALIIFNLPFTLIKGLIDSLICVLIYKPLRKYLK